MEMSFNELRNKEIVNLTDGAKMGRMVDIVFNSESGRVLGVMLPGEKRLFKKSEDIFIPLEKIRRIGNDVILIRFESVNNLNKYDVANKNEKYISNKFYGRRTEGNDVSFVRYRKLDNKKYK